MTTINYPSSRAVCNLTLRVNVTGVRVWRVRLWLGLRLIKLATMVIGCGFEVDR